MIIRKVCFMFGLLLSTSVVTAVENLNPKPKALANEVSTPFRFESPSGRQELFGVLQMQGDYILLGARNAVYNLSVSTLDLKFTIPWKALGQTIEECHMKGKSETECHNYIRIVTPLRNGRLLVCGTHAFSPQCREFEYSSAEDRFAERQEFNGQGLAPYDPHHNSTFVYLPDTNEIFVGTVSDFGANDPLIYRKKLPRGETLRTQKDDLRVIESPDFVGSFAYQEYVYFWYREKAAESVDNNQERQTYARVARVCQNDRGGPSPTHDRWSSFLKARLNCSIPAEVPFYFNEIQSITGPIDDGQGDALVFGVFQTARSSILMSAVCSFKMSQVLAVFDHGRFKTQRTPSSVWSASLQRFAQTERPGKCVSDSRRLNDISFIVKNPLMYDLVPAATDQPLIIEGPAHAELTAIYALKNQVVSVRGQRHSVLFVGRSDGSIGKVVDTTLNQTSVLVENIRVFDPLYPILMIQGVNNNNELIVSSHDRIVKVPIQHCQLQTSCSSCVRLRDPHCAWDVEKRLCVHKSDWFSGSYVQNILTGVSEQCPAQIFRSSNANDNNYIVEGNFDVAENNVAGTIILGHLEASEVNESVSNATTTTLIAIVVTIACALLVGFLIGYRISKWRALNRLKSGHSPIGSSNGSDCDSYGRARLTRHDSLMFNRATHVEHPYSSAPVSRGGADAVSLVFNSSIHNPHHLPMMSSISNGGSGLATPKHAERNLMLSSAGGATLPRDYRVKKVYL